MELYNGDCLVIMDELIKRGVYVNFTFTSPPYNRKRDDKYNNYRDTLSDYYGLLKSATDKTLELSDYVFLNIQKNYYNKEDVFRYIGEYAKEIIDILVWTKTNPMPASGFNITNSWEFIIILSKKHKTIKAKKTYTKNHIETSVYSENPYKKVHRAMMKPSVVEYFIDRFTDKKDIILDPFMGLNTTGVVCKQNNRDFIGIELDETYFDMGSKRLNEIS